MDNARSRLVKCFAAVFADLGEGEIQKATPASVGAWDSLAMLNLVTVIEEEFGVQVAPEDFEKLLSFELILDYLHETGGQKHVS